MQQVFAKEILEPSRFINLSLSWVSASIDGSSDAFIARTTRHLSPVCPRRLTQLDHAFCSLPTIRTSYYIRRYVELCY